MSLRAICLGLLLGLIISAFTFFNDSVAHQTSLIGNFMPVSVFGVTSLLLLLGNPLLFRLRPAWAFRGSELAVMTAIALASCSLPGHNFSRYLVNMTALPARQYSVRTDWQANHLMSYLPGGSNMLAPGQVRDWPTLVERVKQSIPAQTPPARLYTLADEAGRIAWDQAFATSSLTTHQTDALLRHINQVLKNPKFSDALGLSQHELEIRNRQVLDDAMHGLLTPPPPGSGALVAGGRTDPQITDVLAQGLNTGRVLPLDRVPWSLWWPTLRLWVGVVVCLALVCLCLSLIVHYQWSGNELLQYPLATFVEILGRRDEHRGLPHIATNRLFWCGLLALLVLHLVNGLHAWFPNMPRIPLDFNFWGMSQLFPTVVKVPTSSDVFGPTVYLSIVAFAFMLNRSVSFTLGVTPLLFVAFGAVLISRGVNIPYDKFTPNNTNLMRLGAFIGATITLLYTGRTYYSRVVINALGLHRHEKIPHAAVWAARCIAPLLVIAIALLLSSGMSLFIAVVLILICLMIWVVSARIIAETGMVLISGPFLPLGVLPALLGYEALGPTQILLLGIGGFLLVGDPRECLMPFLVNGLRMSERTGTRVTQVAPWMLAILCAGGLIAIVVTVGLQYEYGINFADGYATGTAPASSFAEASRAISQLTADGSLSHAVAMTDLQRMAAIAPQPWALGWMGAGCALILLTMWARVRLSWWPIHPVLFLVLGTWAIGSLAFSFMIGWAVKSLTVYSGGVRAYQQALPLMVGIIAGELIGGLLWLIVGTAYYFHTGLAPVAYSIFP